MNWLREVDSNHRPKPYEGFALGHLSYRALNGPLGPSRTDTPCGHRFLRPARLPDSATRGLFVEWGAWLESNQTTAGITTRSATTAPHAPLKIVGLRGEIRTPDPMLPKHVRYQLRHAEKNETGSRGWERSNDPRLIKTVLCH